MRVRVASAEVPSDLLSDGGLLVGHHAIVRAKMAALYACPYCGEQVDSDPDLGGGLAQEYVEDGPVCCRPNRIVALFVEDLDDYAVQAVRET